MFSCLRAFDGIGMTKNILAHVDVWIIGRSQSRDPGRGNRSGNGRRIALYPLRIASVLSVTASPLSRSGDAYRPLGLLSFQCRLRGVTPSSPLGLILRDL
jgi:hypothetical protein